MAAETSPQIELSLSNLNLPREHFQWATSARYTQILEQLRGGEQSLFPGGFQLTPTRAMWREAVELAAGLEGDLTGHDQPFTSLHQTWPWDAMRDVGRMVRREKAPTLGHLVVNYAGLWVMPSAHNLQPLADIATQFPRITRTVIYADQEIERGHPRNYDEYRRAAGQLVLTQIEPTTLRGSNLAVVLDRLHGQGIDGLSFDPYHFLAAVRTQRQSLPAALRDLETAQDAAPIYELQVSVGRVDTQQSENPEEDRRRTLDDLDAVLKGPEAIEQTEMGLALRAAQQLWLARTSDGGRLPVVLKVPHKGLVEARQRRIGEARKVKIDLPELLVLHEIISGHLTEFLAA